MSKEPEEYIVGDILTLLEGDLSSVPTDLKEGKTYAKNCPDGILWGKINDAIHSVVDHVTLADMREWGE